MIKTTPQPTSNPPRFLIVDDNMKDYLILRKAIVSCGPVGTWVDLADSAFEALATVGPASHEAIIIRDQLPDESAEWLLARLKMKMASHSGIQPCIFILHGEGDSDGFASHILRHFPDVTLVGVPYDEVEFARTAMEAVRPRNRQLRFYNLQLLDLMQAYMMSNRNATIRVVPGRADQAMGIIYIKDGKLIHAVCGNVTGMDALPMIATIRDGRIRLESGCMTARTTISLHSMDALAEATRLMTPHRDLSFLDSMHNRPSDTAEAAETRLSDEMMRDWACRPLRKSGDSSTGPEEAEAETILSPR